MVTDDGTVVSLAGNEAAIESLDEPALPEAPVLAAAPISIGEGDVAPLVADLEADLEPDIAVSEPEPEPEPVPDPEPEPELEIASSPPMFEPEPAAELVEAPALDEFFAEEQEELVMPDAAKRSEPAAQPAQTLVSESTLSASAAALSQLSRTVRRDKEFPLGGGRMVEDLVREALEPMLKEWLDANLAAIVERMVRQEIERMVRRAEEDS
jgi:cell pole-organizing protein PopZ